MATKKMFSSKGSVDDAVAEIKSEFEGFNTKLLVFFSAPTYDPQSIAKEMHNAFPESTVIGCTTAGELISGKMLKDSVVAMGFDEKSIEDIDIGVIAKLKNCNEDKEIRNILGQFEKKFETPITEMDKSKYVGIILEDGLCGIEENLMTVLGYLTDIPFIGGSAGDNMAFKQTHVFANGKSYSNSAILALIKVKKGYTILKTQSFKDTGETMVATKVDYENRKVLEFNGKPAVETYAEKLGVAPENLTDSFRKNPVGLMIEREFFVRSPQKIEGTAVKFFCRVDQDQTMIILESEDIVNKTKEDLQNKLRTEKDIAGILNFHCILRTLELEDTKQCQNYVDLFKDLPMVGFSTYGEQLVGHINQTSTMLMIK